MKSGHICGSIDNMNPAIISAAICIVPTALSIYLFIRLSNLQKRFITLSSGIDDRNLIDIIKQYNKTLESCQGDIEAMNKEFSKIREETATFFRKVGLVRYQGMKDIGGEQSFSLVLLNQRNSGFALTSLYGRDFCKIFSKKIDNGVPSHKLTDEEQQALEQAIAS